MKIVFPAKPLMSSGAGVTSKWHLWSKEFQKHEITKGLFNLSIFKNSGTTSRHISGQIAQETMCGKKYDDICNGWSTNGTKEFHNASGSYINKYTVSGETAWIKKFAIGIGCFNLGKIPFKQVNIFPFSQKV
jgi:hypothetical protein